MWALLREPMPNGAYAVQHSTGMAHVIHRAERPHTFFFMPAGTQPNIIRLHESVVWCKEHFGESGDRWNQGGRVLRFARLEDAVAFRMRWC